MTATEPAEGASQSRWPRVKRLALLTFLCLAFICSVAGIGLKTGRVFALGGHLHNARLAGALALAGWLVVAVLYRRSPRVKCTDLRAGQVVVMFTVAFVILVAVGALAIDVGYLFATEARVQNAADAASRAALQELWNQRASGASETEARTAARHEKTDLAELNLPGIGSEIQFGVWEEGSFTVCDTDTAASAVRVRAFLNGEAPGGGVRTFFAGFLGMNSVSVESQAVARFVHSGLVPFALYNGELGSAGSSVILYNDKEVAPGAFGLIDFNGGENSAADTKEWTQNGYKGSVFIDPAQGSLTLEGTTGLQSSLASAINQHIQEGTELVAPIYRSIWGQASATSFVVIGYVKIIVTGLTWADKHEEELESISASITGKYIVGTAHTEGTMREFMHLQLVR